MTVLDQEAKDALSRFAKDQQEEYASELEYQRSKTEQRDKVRRMYGSVLWRTADGRVVNVKSSMTPQHAKNTLAYLERLKRSHANTLLIWGAEAADEWFNGTTLVQELRKTAARKPTLAERWRDRQSLKQYEAKVEKHTIPTALVGAMLEGSYLPAIKAQLNEPNHLLKIMEKEGPQ